MKFHKLLQPFCSSFTSRIRCRNFGQPAAQTHPHLLKEGEVTPGISKQEYKRRRSKLVSLAKTSLRRANVNTAESLFIFPTAPKLYMTADIPYPYHQNTDFLYLCGFLEPCSVLVMTCQAGKTSDNHRSVLFVQKKDLHKELWDGPRSGLDGSLFLTGVDETHSMDELESYLYQFCKSNSQYSVFYNYLKPTDMEIHTNVISKFLQQRPLCYKDTGSKLIQQLKVVKSEAEINLMQTSVDIACEAFVDVMRFSHPRINEAHLYAKMDFECRIRDAEYLAYPPVVAGGNRANTIHYIQNNQIIEDGDLVLMDAGCEYHGYCSDITRTWPVSGKFTPPQAMLYNAVLRIQLKCIGLCTTDYSLDEVYSKMLAFLGEELRSIGAISNWLSESESRQLCCRLCPHHVGHYLGMDVHDTPMISRAVKLQPGMVVTIEPGVYVPLTCTDLPECYRGLGIRIEDNILVTETNPVVMSQKLLKTVDDIEAIMATSK